MSTSARTASYPPWRRTPTPERCSCWRTSRRRRSTEPSRRAGRTTTRGAATNSGEGASSGHTQEVREVRVDCDADTLLYLVDQNVGACHTGHRSCFYRTVEGEHVGERVFDPDAVYDDE